MLATSKNALFSSHNHRANHQYWWPFTLTITKEFTRLLPLLVLGHQYWWLADGYDLEMDFLEVASMMFTW